MYDAKGRVWKESVPHRTPTTSDYTETAYDALDRVVSVAQPGAAVTSTLYQGPITTVSDPAGVKRRNESDTLGRLTQVVENPDGAGGEYPYTTNYAYDCWTT